MGSIYSFFFFFFKISVVSVHSAWDQYNIYAWYEMCSGRENSYFGLARNLIQHLISPNQDDLSYSARTFFSWQQIGWAAKHTLFGWRTPPSADVSLRL